VAGTGPAFTANQNNVSPEVGWIGNTTNFLPAGQEKKKRFFPSSGFGDTIVDTSISTVDLGLRDGIASDLPPVCWSFRAPTGKFLQDLPGEGRGIWFFPSMVKRASGEGGRERLPFSSRWTRQRGTRTGGFYVCGGNELGKEESKTGGISIPEGCWGKRFPKRAGPGTGDPPVGRGTDAAVPFRNGKKFAQCKKNVVSATTKTFLRSAFSRGKAHKNGLCRI